MIAVAGRRSSPTTMGDRRFVCAACGGAIGVYERCLVVVSGEPVAILSLSLTEDERDAARLSGTYHHGCYSRAPQMSRRPGARSASTAVRAPRRVQRRPARPRI